jgi:hypothetical protein
MNEKIIEDPSQAQLVRGYTGEKDGGPWFIEKTPTTITTVRDMRKGEVLLEKGRQPIYDTQLWSGNRCSIAFFQNPNGRSTAYSNLISPGCFNWPKRFTVDGIRVSFSQKVDISKGYLRLTIGEKGYLTMALANLERDDDPVKDAAAAPTLPPIRLKHLGLNPGFYIPPVQNFCVTIDAGDIESMCCDVRVQLEGTLYREIC